MLVASGFAAAVSAQSDLLGKWIFESSNHVVPEKCTRSDSSRSVVIAYSAERIEAGYNLITRTYLKM